MSRFFAFLLGGLLLLPHAVVFGQYAGNIPQGNVLGNEQTTSRPAGPVAGVIVDPTGSYYKAGKNLLPTYVEPAATTAKTTAGSPTITVASATGIVKYDLINAPFIPFGTYVANIVGTTVTMSTNATSTNTSTAVTFGHQKYSKQNSILTNTLGAENGLFGSAARGHGTWVGQYSPALELNWSSVFAVSPIGSAAVTAASRSLDNNVPGAYTIPSLCIVAVDNPTVPNFSWCQYLESHLPASAAQSTHIQVESSLNNQWVITSGDKTPYNINPSIHVTNMRLDNGINTPAKVATNPLDIVNNGGTYRSGIVFHSTAFDYTDGRILAPAIAMAAKQGSCWYTGAGEVPQWCMWADTAGPVSVFHMRNMFLNDNFLTVSQDSGILQIGNPGVQTIMRGPITANAGISASSISASSISTIGNVGIGGTLNVTGDVATSGDITGNDINATGVVTGGNITTPGGVSAGGNISSTAGSVSAINHIVGSSSFTNTVTDAWTLYTDSTDGNKLKAKHSSGTVVLIATP